MDIEVLNDLYNRAKSLGYKKSRRDFSVLITQDPRVFSDNYEYIKSQGYTKSQDDFKELIGIDVKKKDISKPVGDGKSITDSTTEQVQAQDILSALQPGKPEDTPIPLRPEEQEEVDIEEAPMQPIGFDPKTGVPLSGPVDTQFEFDETQEVPIKEKEFEYVDDEIKKQIKKRLIKTPGLESFKDEDVEVLESKFPNLYYEALDVVTSESKAIEAYEDLSDDVKKQIEPAVVKQGDKVVEIDFSVLSKNNIESLIKEAKNQESVKDILENYISEEKIAYKAAGIKGNELIEEIKDIDKQIEYIKSRGFGLEEIDKLIVESNKKKAQYQGLYNYSAEQSVLLNSAEIAKQNVEMNPLKSGAASAIETVLTLGVQSLPVMGSTLLNVGVTAGLPVAAQSSVRVFSSEKEKEWMEWSLEKKKEIEKFIPTDFDDTKANFVGNVVGQIGFVVGSSVLGGTPLAIAAGYTMSAGEMYEEAVNNGLSHDDAMNLSIAYGTISAPLEILGARKGIEALAGKNLRKKVIDEILKKGAKGFTKEVAEEAVKVSLTPVLKATAFEAGEEGLQEGAQYLISKGLAETYNALKDEDKDEFIKTKLMSFDFGKELVTNVVLGAVGGAIGGASLNLLGGNVFVGSNYKAMEDMFLDSKQMAKVNDQLTAYRKNGTIKTDEELQAAREQVGIVQSAAAEVSNATKTRPDKVGSVQQKRLFELTSERLSIQKEIEGVSTPSLVADRKQRIEELDQEISDVITGKITTEEILDRDKVKTEVTEEELVDDFVVSEEEYENFVDNGKVTEETINKIADIVQQGKKISDKKTLAIYNDKVSEINKILSGRQDSKIAKENKRVDEIFAEEDFDVSEKLSDNLARNKSPEFQIGEKENKIIGLATKAAKAIQRITPNVRVVLHDTTEEYNEFGREGTNGTYNNQTKTIHIDLSEANNTTVAHETFHSILFNTIGTEKDIEAATNDMYESVKRALATSPIMKRKIKKFSEKYGDDLKSEEALSELFGMLSTDYKQLSAPVKVKIKQFINKVATKFGLGDIIKLSEQDLSDLETIDLLNTMSARVKEGKTILKKEAKPLTDKKVKDKKPDTSNENPAIREQKGLINITEKDVIKFKKADITEKRTIQAINQIGLSQVKFKREEIIKKISEEFEKLMNNSDDYLISVDGPAITASIQNEIDNAAEQGYSLEYLENLTGALEEGSPERKRYFDTFVNTQRSSIEQWKNYLSQSDYDPAFKYLILDAVLTNNYDYKLNKYQKRTKSTIRGFTPFDAGSLAEVYASDSKELLKDYVVSQVNNAKNIAEKQLMVTTNEGKWLKFEGGPNANDIAASANALSQLVQDTYWCTKTNAKSQLEGGDFYVYVTDDAGGNPIPRIAVRMEGDRVGEVRGNASAAQDLEADMLPVAEKFLVDNIPNDSGKKWLESINYNKKVKNFTEKINKQKIKKDFVYEYVEILAEEKRFRVDYDENGLVSLMKQGFEDVIFESDLFKNKEVVFDEEQMNENTEILLGGFYGTVKIPNSLKIIGGRFSTGSASEIQSLKNITTIIRDANLTNILDIGNLETIGGDLQLRGSRIKSLGKLKTVGGNIDLIGSQVTSLGNLESVVGTINMYNSQVTDLGKLKSVGDTIELAASQVTSLGNLKTVGRNVYLSGSKVTSLGNLESVGEDIDLTGLQVTDLGNLKTVGGTILLDNPQIKSLGNLESVGGNLMLDKLFNLMDLGKLKSVGSISFLRKTQITSLGKLESINYGDLQLVGTELTSLDNLKFIGGSLKAGKSKLKNLGKLEAVEGEVTLIGSQVADLGDLEVVGGNLDLKDSKITSLGKLKSVGKNIYLGRSKVTSLGKLETVGSNVNLQDSQVKDLGNLKTVGSTIILSDSQVTGLGKLETVGGSIISDRSKLKSLGKIKTVGGDVRLENLQVTSLGDLKSVGGNLDLRDSQVKNLGNLKYVGGVLDLRDSQVTSLGNLEIVGAYIKLQDSQVTSLGKLKTVVGDILGDDELAKQFEDSKQKPAIREQKADVSKIKEARSKLSKAKKNLKRKLGAAVDAGPLLNRLLAVNPTIVPEPVYDKYLEILDMLSENAEELKLDKAQEVSTKTEEILNKIEDESAKEPEKEKGKKKEYKREKNKLIKDIKKAASVRNPKFALNEESVFAKYLKKLAKSKAVEELSINELKTLSRVLDNINNGWLSHTAWRYATKLQGITNSNVATDAIAKAKLGFVTNAYNNFKRFIRFTEKGTVQKALESIPKYYIDQALSVGQSTDIFDSVLRGIAEAEQIYNFDLRAINKRITAVENAVLKSLKYDGNKAIESSVKQMIYLLNLEYKSNEGNTQVNPVIDFINETIANKKTDKVEKERLNQIKKEYFDGKKLKEKKLFNSFNNAEKESIKEIQKINAELGSKALYTAGVVRGDRIDLLNNYVHHVVIDEKFDGSEVKNVESQIKDFVDSRKPTTKAKSLIQRTGKVTPLNFDIYNSASRGAKYTLMDFYLTEPISTVRETLKRTEEKLKEKGIYDEKSDIFEGIEALLEQDIETTLTNNIASSALIERVVGEISKVAYQRILLNTKRLAQELLGNMSYIVLKGRKAFKEGLNYFDVMSSETGPEVMRVVGSLQLNRTYQDADINSRFVEKYNNELSGIRGKKSRSKVVNTAAKIHTATTKKLKNFNDKTASVLMSAPDQIMNRPLWFGTFALEFKKESGVDVDFERIAGKSEAYLEKHAEAIEKAKKKADDVSIEAAASEGLFTGISKGKDWKTEKNALKGSAKFLFYNFNNFMNKFLVYEYTSFAKGWKGLINNGTLSQAEGVFLMAAVTSRMYMYSLLANTGMTGLIGLLSNLLGITDKPEEDDEDIRYGAARAGVQTLVNLSQRNFGNATRSLLNWGVEYANENYLDALREGDYNQYKNSIVYNVKPYRDNWIVPFAGPFSPVIKTATLASDAYFPDYEVTQKAAIERRNKEKYVRVPLEILAATGYLPMSNEIIKEVNADIYKDLIKGKKGGVNSSMFDESLFNKSLFKK